MFANAYQSAINFTRPVIISIRYFDNTVESGCGAYIVVNNEGWIITVAHLWQSYFLSQQHVVEISDYNKQVEIIQNEPALTLKHKRKKIGRLNQNPKWILNHSFYWGIDGMQLKDIKYEPELDLVVGRLEPFDPKSIKISPTFKNISNLQIGTSLCKLGFPFHNIEAMFEESTNSFKLNTAQIIFFPLEGICTRYVLGGKTKDGKYEIKLLETSSPGLRGQSGGPIFDINGTIWAIQSRTMHFPLGFSPKINKNGKEIEENQFLNVGLGVHPEVIFRFLNDNKIKFLVSTY